MIDSNQQIKTNANYKELPFNMSIAELICDGSVNGKVWAYKHESFCISFIGQVTTITRNNGVYTINVHSVNDKDSVYIGTYVVDSCGNFVLKDGTKCHLHMGIDIGEVESVTETCDSLTEEKHDSHYHKCKIEPIEYILANGLGFCEGCVVKYITRYKDKGNPLDDLRKIKVYVDYLIDDLTKKENA